MEVRWLQHHASNTGAMDSIPGWGTKILHAAGVRGQEWGQKEERRGRGKVSKKRKQHVSEGKNKGCWGPGRQAAGRGSE